MLEGAILALLIERRPRSLTPAELLREMGGGTGSPGPIEAAVEGLAEVGLLRRERSALAPTPAAVRAAEIELGLP
jgi:hypothetical protein